MPSRVLREGILDSRAVNSLSQEAELFYWHLLLVVDDYGRHEADPELLSVKCFPRRYAKFDSHMTGRCLTDVSNVLTDDGQPLVTLYTVGNKKYLQVNNFNQRMRAKKSRCPSPDSQMPVTCQTDDGHMTAPPHACASSESESESDIGVGYRSRTSESDGDPEWDRLEREYPGVVKPDWDCQLFISLVETPEDHQTFWRNFALWTRTRQWGEGFVPNLGNFLESGQWKKPPPPEPERKSERERLLESI